MSARELDAIVIGSGMGSLACASLLAQMKGMRILVLERHFKPGGFTHTFRRPGGYEWDVGVHYVGEMNEGSLMRRLMDLVTQGRVAWNKMPSPYDVFVYPDIRVAVPEGARAFESDLISAFPRERDGIRQYFRDVKRMYDWNSLRMLSQGLRQPARGLTRWLGSRSRLARETTASYLQRSIRDERLRGVLTSQWGAYGLPPSQAPFFVHATMAQHFFEGGYYPEGGGRAIADSVLPILESRGGECRLNHHVTEILVERGRAVGVRANVGHRRSTKPVEYRAPLVISGAGAYTTYRHLLRTPVPFRDALDDLARCSSFVTLYLGLRENPARLGFNGENHWIFTGYDHDDIFARRNTLAQGQAVGAYLSFPSLKNASATRHTAEIIAPLDHDVVANWSAQPWRRRDQEYQALKARITDALLRLVEQHHPGFRALVDFHELSTPITVENFTGHNLGAIYGLPATAERFQSDWLSVRTPVTGLLLTGSDVANLGVAGALFGGVVTAAHHQGTLGFLKIMATARS